MIPRASVIGCTFLAQAGHNTEVSESSPASPRAQKRVCVACLGILQARPVVPPLRLRTTVNRTHVQFARHTAITTCQPHFCRSLQPWPKPLKFPQLSSPVQRPANSQTEKKPEETRTCRCDGCSTHICARWVVEHRGHSHHWCEKCIAQWWVDQDTRKKQSKGGRE